MKKIIPLLYLGLGSLAIFTESCQAPKIVEKSTDSLRHEMPNQYKHLSTDTFSLAQIPWQTFFPDSQLRTLIDTAILHNFDLRIANERINIASNYLLQAKGAFLPSISLDANASGTKYGKYTMEGVGNYDTNLSSNINEDQKTPTNLTPNYWLGTNISWQADIWGQLHNLKKAEELNLLNTVNAKQYIYSNLVKQVAGLYYNLQALDKEDHIAKENILLQEDAVRRVKDLKEGGRSNELAVQQFLAQLINTQSMRFAINQQMVETENQLNSLLGRFQYAIQRSDSLHAIDSAIVKLGIPTQLLANRPDIRAAESSLLASNANVKAARAAFFPTLNLNGYAAFNAFKGNLLFSAGSLAYQLAGGLSAPILQKNQIRAKFNIAKADQEIAFIEYQQKVVNAYQEVASQFRKWENNQHIMQSKQQQVEVLTKGVNTANELFFGGQSNYLDIFTAQQNKLNAQLEYIAAQKDVMLALVDLYQAVGGGWK